MRSEQPPALAHWLLKHFGCSPNNETVIGDLSERYRQGHSRGWYWGQALSAIAIGLVTFVRSDRSLAIRALAIGWGLIFLSAPALPLILHMLVGRPAGTGLLPTSWTKVEWLYVRGWIVPEGDAYTFAAISCLFAFTVGWLVGRFNRPNQRQAIVVFLASWLASFLISIPVVLLRVLRDWSASGWTYDNPYFFAFGVAGGILAMLSALAGGIVSGPTQA
jgi:hypothetical protein